MSDLRSEIADNRSAARPKRNTRLLAAGFILWTLVALVAIVMFRNREALRRDAQAGTNGGAAAATNVSPPAGEHQAESNSAVGAWDQAGVKDFTFTERSGRQVTKADLLGHPWLVSFIFTRCAGPCPRVTAQMSELQKLLEGSDVKLVTLSVDPDFDTTDVLKRYADAYKADADRWLYLTGDKAKTYRLISESFLMPVKEMTGADREPGFEVLHSTNILLVNEQGVVVKKYNALNEVEMATLRKDLRPYLKTGGPQKKD
jgi:cytochrome oxidase Cu insertion factor (SCO1/SenC/PrrC family)